MSPFFLWRPIITPLIGTEGSGQSAATPKEDMVNEHRPNAKKAAKQKFVFVQIRPTSLVLKALFVRANEASEAN